MGKQKRDDRLIVAIGKKMQALRKAKGVSQIDVYIDTNVNVKRIEVGAHNISVSTLSALCDYYGITLEEFFREIDTAEREAKFIRDTLLSNDR